MINRIITLQSLQISFNRVMDGLGILIMLLIPVLWLARPLFIRRTQTLPPSTAAATGG